MHRYGVVMSAASDALARGERRRARTSSSILDAAEALIADQSIDSIRIQDVAEKAAVSPASVYVHFGTKDALVAAVVDRLLVIGGETLDAAYNADLAPFERFTQIGVAYLNLLIEHPALLKYLAATGDAEPASDRERAANARMTELRERFEVRIREAIEAGRVRRIDARLMSYYLMGSWNGVAALALRKDGLALTPSEVEAAVLQAGLIIAKGMLSP